MLDSSHSRTRYFRQCRRSVSPLAKWIAREADGLALHRAGRWVLSDFSRFALQYAIFNIWLHHFLASPFFWLAPSWCQSSHWKLFSKLFHSKLFYQSIVSLHVHKKAGGLSGVRRVSRGGCRGKCIEWFKLTKLEWSARLSTRMHSRMRPRMSYIMLLATNHKKGAWLSSLKNF